MRFWCVAGALLIMSITSSIASAASIQCNPELKVIWSFNQASKSSEFQEVTNNLPIISLFFDHGFIKITNESDVKKTIFRQSAIIRSDYDPLELTVRYESINGAGIEKKSIIISDPMCKKDKSSWLTVVETAEMKYASSIYGCVCLSSFHDSGNFIDIN